MPRPFWILSKLAKEKIPSPKKLSPIPTLQPIPPMLRTGYNTLHLAAKQYVDTMLEIWIERALKFELDTGNLSI